MLLNMVMFKVTICDIGKMNINMTDKIGKKGSNLCSAAQWRGQQRLYGRRGDAAYRVCSFR